MIFYEVVIEVLCCLGCLFYYKKIIEFVICDNLFLYIGKMFDVMMSVCFNCEVKCEDFFWFVKMCFGVFILCEDIVDCFNEEVKECDVEVVK